MLPKLLRKIQRIAVFLRPMQLPLHGAYTAFFLILSLFPSLLLFLGLLRLTGLRTDALLQFLQDYLPEQLLPLARILISSSGRHRASTMVSLSALAALWSASRGMFGLLRGLLAVRGQGGQGYWKKRAVSVAYTGLFLVALVLTLAVHVFGNAVLDYLWMRTEPALMALMRAVDLRFILLLVLQTALFSGIYALTAGPGQGFGGSLPGGLLASLGYLIFSRLFSVYMAHFSRYTDIYGSVYALALGMLWLYCCICIVLYCAAFNRFLRERKG